MKTLLFQDIETVSLAVCGHFGVTRDEIHSKSREERIVLPRHVTWYLLHTLCGSPATHIAKAFDRDHSTVQKAFTCVRNRLATDAQFMAAMFDLDSRCKILLEAK